MAKPLINIRGQRFGMLVVLERTDVRDTRGQRTWLCQCDCGNTVHYNTGQLRHGGVTSCGCDKPERKQSALTVPPQFADCVACAPPGKYTSGCEALTELLCAKKGKCAFYAPRQE